jgi:hypothetical protein
MLECFSLRRSHLAAATKRGTLCAESKDGLSPGIDAVVRVPEISGDSALSNSFISVGNHRGRTDQPADSPQQARSIQT